MIAGWAQLSERGDEPDSEPRPDEMLAAVARGALERSGAAPALLDELTSIAVVDSVSWPVSDPGRLLAGELGASGVESVRSRIGGCAPVELLADACERIQAGEHEAVLIAGVECVDALMRARKAGREPGFADQDEVGEPDRFVGEPFDPSHPVELAAGLIAPVAYYPLLESAVRARAGRAPAEHLQHLGQLWSRFAAVAKGNPHAWNRKGASAETIAQPAPENRRVSIPYTKLMNSNIQTNQAAALLVCSRGLAERAGIEETAWVPVLATATAADRHYVCQRPDLDRSPALRAAAAGALAQAGVELDGVRHLDLYSCFPSAVQIAANELGIDPLDPGRAPTVTGGLGFAGGPGSNYVTHSLASICDRIDEQGGIGMATSVSWYMSKHGVAVLGTAGERGGRRYGHRDPQAEIDAAGPGFEIIEVPEARDVFIEAYTAICDRSGAPELGIATFMLSGRRTVAKADDSDTLAALATGDCIGACADLSPDGRFRIV